MTDFQTPLDAPLEIPPQKQGLFLPLLLQFCCFPLLASLYYLGYWEPVNIALFGMASLLLLELASTKLIVSKHWPSLRPLGYFVGVLFMITTVLSLISGFWILADVVRKLGLLLMALYTFTWSIRPIGKIGAFPKLRLLLGGILISYCWTIHCYYNNGENYFAWMRLSLVISLLCLLCIAGIYWVIPKEKQGELLDFPTLVRVPQLLHIVLGVGIGYYQYGSLFLG